MLTYVATGLDTLEKKGVRVDYNRVLGYGIPVERIDPHVHVLRPQIQPELLELVRAIRSGIGVRPPDAERKEDARE